MLFVCYSTYCIFNIFIEIFVRNLLNCKAEVIQALDLNFNLYMLIVFKENIAIK